MGTCACVIAYACDRVRALRMREYAACVRVRRAYFVRPSINGIRTYTVYVYTMHACIYIHARLATLSNGSPMRARRTHAPTCCVRARARACVRVRLGAHASAPTHASAFRRRGPRVARLAGVPLGVGVQREHRRVEHRVCVEHGRGMRRLFGPAARTCVWVLASPMRTRAIACGR